MTFVTSAAPSGQSEPRTDRFGGMSLYDKPWQKDSCFHVDPTDQLERALWAGLQWWPNQKQTLENVQTVGFFFSLVLFPGFLCAGRHFSNSPHVSVFTGSAQKTGISEKIPFFLSDFRNFL